MNWLPLNGGRSVITPAITGAGRGWQEWNTTAALMRDPSILRGPDGMFHLVWTVAWLVTWLPPLKFLLARLAQAARWPGRRRMRPIQERFDREYRTLFELRHGEPVARPRKDSAA